MNVSLSNKLLTTMACLVIAILLMSNLSAVAAAESDLAICTDDETGSLGSADEIDLIYYSALGAGSATVGGIIGAFTYMEVYNKLLGAQLVGGVGTEVRLWTLPVSAGAGILGGLAAAAILFSIGYGIYQAVTG